MLTFLSWKLALLSSGCGFPPAFMSSVPKAPQCHVDLSWMCPHGGQCDSGPWSVPQSGDRSPCSAGLVWTHSRMAEGGAFSSWWPHVLGLLPPQSFWDSGVSALFLGSWSCKCPAVTPASYGPSVSEPSPGRSEGKDQWGLPPPSQDQISFTGEEHPLPQGLGLFIFSGLGCERMEKVGGGIFHYLSIWILFPIPWGRVEGPTLSCPVCQPGQKGRLTTTWVLCFHVVVFVRCLWGFVGLRIVFLLTDLLLPPGEPSKSCSPPWLPSVGEAGWRVCLEVEPPICTFAKIWVLIFATMQMSPNRGIFGVG